MFFPFWSFRFAGAPVPYSVPPANILSSFPPKDLKCAKPRLTQAGVSKLQSYDSPGNVRELRNVIERAVILARGGSLEFDLPMTQAASPLFACLSRAFRRRLLKPMNRSFSPKPNFQLREREKQPARRSPKGELEDQRT